MSTRSTLLLTLILATPGAAPLAAQAVALGDAAASRPPALAAAYHLTLTSDWPETGDGGQCGNAGEEVVEGTLTRSGPERYAGRFHRRTVLRFCGAHGGSSAPCTMTLEGAGTVAAVGDVVADARSESGRALRLIWTPEPGHAARTEGACAAEFKAKVRVMYLAVRHGVELPLPPAGAARRTERLEGYAWTVAIE